MEALLRTLKREVVQRYHLKANVSTSVDISGRIILKWRLGNRVSGYGLGSFARFEVTMVMIMYSIVLMQA